MRNEDNMKKRFRFQFYGIVQGVGFRYTATHTATRYGLTGYVVNEYDGSVICEVQGYEASIKAFLLTIENARFIDITGIDKKELPEDPEERSFEVRY